MKKNTKSKKRGSSKSRISRKRTKHIKKIKGGNVAFPASIVGTTQFSSIAAAPQSFVPYNDFSNDPNYGVINARLTQPFLTGVYTGGKRRSTFLKKPKSSKNAKFYKNPKSSKKTGGSPLAQGLSELMNYNFGAYPSAALPTDAAGVAGISANLAGISNANNNNPAIPTPLA